MSRAFPRLQELEASLREIPHPELAGAELEAAVLVCLHEDALLLVQRGYHAGDRWSGQVALPGGRHEPDDASLLRTALRETEEEVGFVPEAHGRVVGSAGAWLAQGPWPETVRIAIYVAALHARPRISVSNELTAAYWVALDSLVTTVATVPEKSEPVPAYVVTTSGRELVVWGITFRILEHLRSLASP
ncbi:MAG: CoA pyrophosphatase [Gaiellales bacterium]